MDAALAFVVAVPVFVGGFVLGGYFFDNQFSSPDTVKPIITGLVLAILAAYLVFRNQRGKNSLGKTDSKQAITAFTFLILLLIVLFAMAIAYGIVNHA
jgi:hypothetical protein